MRLFFRTTAPAPLALLVWVFCSGSPAFGQDQACRIAPLTGADPSAHAALIDENFRCLEQRLDQLSGKAQATTPTPAAAPPLRMFQLGQITLRLDSVALTDNQQQVLSTWTIANGGPLPRLALIDRQRSEVIPAGEAEGRRYKVEGLAECFMNTGNSTPGCAAFEPARWTQLDPGQSYGFRMVTSDRGKPAPRQAVSFTLRLVLKDGEKWEFKDISAANVPLGGQAGK